MLLTVIINFNEQTAMKSALALRSLADEDVCSARLLFLPHFTRPTDHALDWMRIRPQHRQISGRTAPPETSLLPRNRAERMAIIFDLITI